MPPNNFFDKVQHLVVEQELTTLLFINPTIEKMPLPIRRFDDPFLPFGKAVINATGDLVCGYMFNFVDYLALGAAGAVALERTIAYAGNNHLTILHGAFSHINYIRFLDVTAFNADAITIIPEITKNTSSVSQQVITVDGQLSGIYNTETKRIDVGLDHTTNVQINVAGDDVLYAGFGEDFSEVLRNRVGEFNARHH
ncbi:MAG: hypothetical protein RLP44_03430 [Aggregatilineales bacterium]